MESLLLTAASNAVVATLLALLAAAVGRYARRPALTHALWLLVLLKLVTPPLWHVPVFAPEPAPVPVAAAEEVDAPVTPVAVPAPPVTAPAPPATVADENQVGLEELLAALLLTAEAPPAAAEEVGAALPTVEPSTAEPPPVVAPVGDFSWRSLLLALWVVGSAAWLLLTVGRVWRFNRLLRYATPAPADLRAEVETIAHQLHLPTAPAVYLLPGHLSPMLWALGGQPRLLLPAELLGRLDAGQRATLLAHELAHLRRRDHLTRALEIVVAALYWWHPVVWWARRELREAEEQCCDAWVVWALPDLARAYADALVETLDFLSETRTALPPSASGIGHVADVRKRLTMILRGDTPRSLTWRGALAACGLGLLLPLLPGRADPPADAPKKAEEKKIIRIERVEKRDAPAEKRPEAERRDGDRREVERREVERRADAERREVERRGGQGGDERRRIEEDVRRMHVEMEAMQQRMREAEAAMRRAHERLRELGGRGPDAPRGDAPRGDAPRPDSRRVDGPKDGEPKGERRMTIIIRDQDGKTREITVPPHNLGEGMEKLREALREIPGNMRFELGGPGPFGPAGGRGPGPDRMAELEKKLDALLREVESLRREVRRDGPGRPGAEQRGPVAPRPPDAPRTAPVPPRPPEAPRAPGSVPPRDGDRRPQ